MTTRKLAERVEYRQPVLYSHFDGKDAIVRAVALDGFEELAALLRGERLAAEPSPALRAVCRFASTETPAPLRASFDEFVNALGADDQPPELYAEVIWSALHGHRSPVSQRPHPTHWPGAATRFDRRSARTPFEHFDQAMTVRWL